MSTVRAVRNSNAGNANLRLVVDSLPGSRNFPRVFNRIFTLFCVLAVAGGAFHLVGGNYRELVHLRPLAAILGLTFAIGTFRIGFRSTLGGYIASIFGPHAGRDEGQRYFNEHVRHWTLRAAHLYCLMHLYLALPQLTDLARFGQTMTGAALGYLYAILLGLALRNDSQHENVRFRARELVMPVACIAIAYGVFRFLI